MSCSTNSGRSGRGPTKLISPRNTFKICGNSSIRVLRIKLPTLVILKSLSVAHWGVPDSAFSIMLRNFKTSKTSPNSPTLFCLYKKLAFRPSSQRIAAIVANMTGQVTTNNIELANTSNARSRITLTRPRSKPFEKINQLGCSRSSSILPISLSKNVMISTTSTPLNLQFSNSSKGNILRRSPTATTISSISLFIT